MTSSTSGSRMSSDVRRSTRARFAARARHPPSSWARRAYATRTGAGAGACSSRCGGFSGSSYARLSDASQVDSSSARKALRHAAQVESHRSRSGGASRLKMYRRVTSSGRSSIEVIGDEKPRERVPWCGRHLDGFWEPVAECLAGRLDKSIRRDSADGFPRRAADHVPDRARARGGGPRARDHGRRCEGRRRGGRAGFPEGARRDPDPPSDRVEFARASRSFPLPNAASFPPDSRGDRPRLARSRADARAPTRGRSSSPARL